MIAKAVTAVALTAFGLLGLHVGVEYSGWVLAAGLLIAWSME